MLIYVVGDSGGPMGVFSSLEKAEIFLQEQIGRIWHS